MTLPRRRVAPAVLSSLACAAGLSACASAPPEPPKPPPPKEIIAVPPPPPPPTAEPAPPPPPPEIGSKFEVDPMEPLPPGAVARCGTGRMRAASPRASAVSNTGSIFAVDSVSSRWVLRDVTRGQDLTTLPSGQDAAFAPDASFVVTASSYPSGVLTFFSVPEGKRIGETKIPLPASPAQRRNLFTDTTRIRSLHAAPDGTAVVVVTSDGSAHLVDSATHKLVKTTKLPAKTRLAGISRGGHRAVLEHLDIDLGSLGALLGGGRASLTGYSVLDLRTGATPRKETFKKPPRDPDDPDYVPVSEHADASFRLSPDGAKVLRHEHGGLWTIDVATGKESEILGRSTPAATPGLGSFGLGTLGGFVHASREEVLRVWDNGHVLVEDDIIDLADGRVVKTIGAGFEAISANGEHIVTREDSLFNISSGGPDVRPGHDKPVTGLAFLPDNRLAAVAGTARIWKTDTCMSSEALGAAATSVVTAAEKPVAFFSKGSPVLLDEKGQRKRLKLDPSQRLAALSPDGSTLFLGHGGAYGGEGKLVAHDLGEESGRRESRSFPVPLHGIAVSRDGAVVAVSLWERYGQKTATLQLLARDGLATTAEVDVRRAGDLAFAGSEAVLHAPDRSGISVHAVPSLVEQRRLHHKGCCEVIAASPDGRLAAGAEGRGFVIWDIASRRRVAAVERAHREDIRALAFSPDSHHLATGSNDTTVLLWDIRKLGVPALPSQVETRVRDAAAAKVFFGSTSRFYRIKADGTLESTASGAKVPAGLKSVTRVASAVDAHCAVADGKVRCWGTTRGGVLGVPEKKGATKWSHAELTVPTTVPVSDPVDVQINGEAACALSRGGDLACWGRWAYGGKIAAPATLLRGVTSFHLARDRVCAAGNDGLVRCAEAGTPGPAPLGVKDAVAFAGGLDHLCILDKAGAVHCRGANHRDQLGDDTGMDRVDPVTVSGLPKATAIAASIYGTCALTTPAAVHCWGMIGDTHLDHATRLPTLDGATAVHMDDKSVCALIADHVDCLDLSRDD